MLVELVGTLVLMIATASGLVVAADSRSTTPEKSCDNRTKILMPATPSRTVVAVTGHGTVLEAPEGVHNVCDLINSAPRILDIGTTVLRYIEKTAGDLPDLSLRDLGDECLEAVRQYAVLRPGALNQYVGREMFLVVLASFDPKTKTAYVRGLRVGVSDLAEPVVVEELKADMDDDQPGFAAFGESKYLSQHVFRGIGQQFLSDETKRLKADKPPAKNMSLDMAVAAAENIIDAASRTTALVPLDGSGIGGPVDVVLLGVEPRPQKLRWKN